MGAVLALLLACLAPFPAAATIAQSTLLLGGEAQIGTEPPIRLHVELIQNGEQVSGTFSAEDMSLPFSGTRNGQLVSGRLGGNEPMGEATLRLSSSGAQGEFALGDQKGTLRLEPTTRPAKTFLRPPQIIDLSARQWNEDLDALVRILSTKHGNAFHHMSRAHFMREVEKVRKRLAISSGIENALALRRLGALVGDGHTEVGFVRGRALLPLETYWFEDGLHVVAAPADRPDLLGTRVLSIGGVPVKAVVHRLRNYIGQAETEWAYRSSVPYLLYRVDLLEAVGAARSGEAHFQLRGKSGTPLPVSLKGEASKRATVRLGGEGPLWQRRPNESFWHQRWPGDAVYLNWRGYDDLSAKSRLLLAALDRERPKRLLIDLRDNGGGDFNVGREFIKAIQERPWLNKKGVLYVLVGRATFSAAMTNAVDFMKLTNATLVGEPVGARPNGWQEVRRDFLPNSGLPVSISTKHYNFLPGQPIVRPHIEVPPRIDDWSSERDAAVTKALAL